MHPVTALIIFFATVNSVSADPVDYVHPAYINQTPYQKDARIIDAQKTIVSLADKSQQKETPSAINSKIVPPSGDIHDYLSWAPYHWPNCNWCGSPSSKQPTRFYLDPRASDNDMYHSDPYTSASDDYGSSNGDGEDDDVASSFQESDSRPATDRVLRRSRVHMHRMIHSRQLGTTDVDDTTHERTEDTRLSMIPEAEAQAPFVEQPLITTIPTGAVSTPGDKTIISSSPTATDAASGSSGPQAAIKTKQPEHTCTPSPTKSTAPSATWTTCPYETRDGKVNPDTRSLSGPGTINTISQDVLYNAIAYALSKKAAYAQTVSKLTDVLFRNADTYLNPNVNFGQVVRGPGQNMGTFTGILDFRGMVKIINGLQILKVAGYSATKESSDGLQRWFQQYGKWLDTNTLSKKAGTRPNNHGTFFALQHAAVKMALGDYSGAKQVIQKFFDEIFPDQIAQSGEQPFEAVRTRPFHYRCFNLEALIALCKIADALGMECWNKKSKYGTGIQDAIDFTMKQIPKNENAAELVPHLAAAAAVFGDPLGKYATYMQKVQSNYKQRPFWYYDQPGALNFGTGSGKAKRGDTSPTVLFDCPRIFEIEGGEVEIEDGLFVTCAELQPFFELPSSTD